MPNSAFQGRYLSCYFRPKGVSTRSKQIKWFGRVVSRNKPLDMYQVIWAIGPQNLTDAKKVLSSGEQDFDDDDDDKTSQSTNRRLLIANYIGLKELGTLIIPMQGDVVHWENPDEGSFIGKVIDDPQNLRHLEEHTTIGRRTEIGDDDYLFDWMTDKWSTERTIRRPRFNKVKKTSGSKKYTWWPQYTVLLKETLDDSQEKIYQKVLYKEKHREALFSQNLEIQERFIKQFNNRTIEEYIEPSFRVDLFDQLRSTHLQQNQRPILSGTSESKLSLLRERCYTVGHEFMKNRDDSETIDDKSLVAGREQDDLAADDDDDDQEEEVFAPIKTRFIFNGYKQQVCGWSTIDRWVKNLAKQKINWKSFRKRASVVFSTENKKSTTFQTIPKMTEIKPLLQKDLHLSSPLNRFIEDGLLQGQEFVTMTQFLGSRVHQKFMLNAVDGSDTSNPPEKPPSGGQFEHLVRTEIYAMPWDGKTPHSDIRAMLHDFQIFENCVDSMANRLYSQLTRDYDIIACELAVFDPFRTFFRDDGRPFFMESRVDVLMLHQTTGRIAVVDLKTKWGKGISMYKMAGASPLRQLVIYAWLLFVNYQIQVDEIVIAYVNRKLETYFVTIPLYAQPEKPRRNSRSTLATQLDTAVTDFLDTWYAHPGQYFDDILFTTHWPLTHSNMSQTERFRFPFQKILRLQTMRSAWAHRIQPHFSTSENILHQFCSKHKDIDSKLVNTYEQMSLVQIQEFLNSKDVIRSLADKKRIFEQIRNDRPNIHAFYQGNSLFTWHPIRLTTELNASGFSMTFGDPQMLNFAASTRRSLDYEEEIHGGAHASKRHTMNQMVVSICGALESNALSSPKTSQLTPINVADIRVTHKQLWKHLIATLCTKPEDDDENNQAQNLISTRYDWTELPTAGFPLPVNEVSFQPSSNRREHRNAKRIVIYRFAHRMINHLLLYDLDGLRTRMNPSEQDVYVRENGVTRRKDVILPPYPRDLRAWNQGDQNFTSGSRRQAWSHEQLDFIESRYLPHVSRLLRHVIDELV